MHLPEEHLDLIDYRAIASSHWGVFENDLAYGVKGSKDKRTEWMVKLNEIRKIVMHAGTKGRNVDHDQLSFLRDIQSWINKSEDEVESTDDSDE